jgi:uncharacterized damage-inducible protein DinB
MNSTALLAQLQREAEQTTEDVRMLVSGFSDEQLNRRPDAESWSIAQCLEHLVLTGEAYHPRVNDVLEKSGSGRKPYRPTVFGRLFLAMGGPRVRLPLKAHRLFQPSRDAIPDSAGRLIEQQAELIDLLSKAEYADLRTRVPAPHLRLLSLNVGETLTMLVRHQQRHVAQAQRVRQEITK